MFTATKYRIYPTDEQESKFIEGSHVCRFFWNYLLTQNMIQYQHDKKFMWHSEMCRIVSALKKDLPWMNAVPAQSLHAVAKYMEIAIKKFLNPKEPDIAFPKFKKKKSDFFGIKVPNNNNSLRLIDNKHIQIPKFGSVKIKYHRPVTGKLIAATITRDVVGHWYVSLMYDNGLPTPAPLVQTEQNTVGIDVGVKTFAVASNGKEFHGPDLKPLIKKIEYLQSRKDKKKKGSKNRNKLTIKINKLWRKLTAVRSHFHHTTSAAIAKQADFVCIENLDIKEMMKNPSFAKEIGNQAWGEFYRQLEYKLEKKGGEVIRIAKYFPSTQCCSCCGNVLYGPEKLGIQDRTYSCAKCGLVTDRDANASINIKQYGLFLKGLVTNPSMSRWMLGITSYILLR